jgi:hypothetical protein
MMSWVRQQGRIYLGNAGSVRDFRTQLRGNRAPIYFTIYLFVLFMFSLTAYAAIESFGERSVSELQTMLVGYYHGILTTLEGLVLLVAPVLAATSIVAEHQRKSMDLLMSAPVTPKYFFVGKLVSGYRYVWMLLALSLPVTATCVVLGGATWTEVLEAYLILSLHALVYTAIALPIGMMAQKAVGAVLWSLIAVGAYAGLANLLGFGIGGMSTMMSMAGGIATNEMPPWLTLAPFSSSAALGTHCTIWGTAVPNWLISIGLHLILVKGIVMGAGSAMGRFGAAETKGLRIFGLILVGLIVYFLSSSALAVSAGASGSLGTPVDVDGYILGWQVVLPSIFLMPFAPHILCWGAFAERKFGPDRLLVFRNMFKGGTGGGVPYLVVMLAVILGAVVIAHWSVAAEPSMNGLLRALWAVSAWVVIVAAARFASAVNKGELDASRKLFVVFLIAWMLMPLPVLLVLDAAMQSTPGEMMTWAFYGLSGIFCKSQDMILASGLINIVLGSVLLYSAEQKRKVRGLIEVSQVS